MDLYISLSIENIEGFGEGMGEWWRSLGASERPVVEVLACQARGTTDPAGLAGGRAPRLDAPMIVVQIEV